MREVPLHGLDRDHELVGDLAVGQAGGRELGDPPLGDGQRREHLAGSRPGRLAEPVEQPADPALQRPQLLASGVLLGAAQQHQRLVLLGRATGEQQLAGEVGLDLGDQPGGGHVGEHGAGLAQQRDAVTARVDDGQGAQAERRRRTAPRRAGRAPGAHGPARRPGRGGRGAPRRARRRAATGAGRGRRGRSGRRRAAARCGRSGRPRARRRRWPRPARRGRSARWRRSGRARRAAGRAGRRGPIAVASSPRASRQSMLVASSVASSSSPSSAARSRARSRSSSASVTWPARASARPRTSSVWAV